MIEEFERHLRGTNLSENTISSYLFALRQYSSQYDGITKKNLRAYKVWLVNSLNFNRMHPQTQFRNELCVFLFALFVLEKRSKKWYN